jgi:16S rRNA (guanine(966)-N(2))-methyltransferase RsmD
MIRIISGLYKGKKLKRVHSPNVRPMPDKLKGSLFSIINSDIPEKDFLDGFAGTGSVGIEALSRGARLVVFIDEFYPAVKIIRHNLDKCQAGDKAIVLHKEFNRAVINLARDELKFDLIFLDPPYRLLDERNPLKVIFKRSILKETGLIILRHHFKTKFETKYFKLERKVRMGDDVLSFHKK